MGYATQRYFDDVKVGDELTPVVKGPMSPAHIMRWSASSENWHRIHYDYPFSTGHDKNPGLLINGSWKQHLLAQMLDEWAGLEGWVAKICFQYRAMNIEWAPRLLGVPHECESADLLPSRRGIACKLAHSAAPSSAEARRRSGPRRAVKTGNKRGSRPGPSARCQAAQPSSATKG